MQEMHQKVLAEALISIPGILENMLLQYKDAVA